MKTIYNVYVPIESQEQADRMKQICIDYGLPYWGSSIAFISYTKFDYFLFGINVGFAVYCGTPSNKTQVTELEFLELVKINFANSK